MADDLKNLKYALIQQENDPLEFCVITLPIPSQVGIPFFPCELPNNFSVFQSNEAFSQTGMVINKIHARKLWILKRSQPV